MHSPLIVSSALAARLLFMIPLITRGSCDTSTTTVQDGDTFLAIADSAGIPVESLEAANPGVAASDLYVGQAINIPTNNEPAAAMPVSNPASEAVTATAPTTLVTSASPPASSNALPSGSPSAASSPITTQDSSAASSSPAIPDSSTATSETSISSSSAVSSMDTASGSASAAHSTTASATSSSTPAATSSSAPAATSTTAPPPPPPPSTTAPPPPPSAPPGSTTSSTPNSPPAPVSCAPSPTGQYHDAADVKHKTNKFCADKAGVLLTDVQAGTVVDGSDQKANKDDGSSNNEAGYNMTVTAIPDCILPAANILYPLPGATDFNCTKLLYNAWETCYSNDGMGGSIAAGCLVYTFHADP